MWAPSRDIEEKPYVRFDSSRLYSLFFFFFFFFFFLPQASPMGE